MNEKSHRVLEVCEKKVDKTLLHTTTRRLDGHRLLGKFPVEVPPRSGCAFESHSVALTLKGLDGTPRGAGCVPPVEVVRPWFVIRTAGREDIVRRAQHRVGDSHDRLLMASVPHDPSIT